MLHCYAGCGGYCCGRLVQRAAVTGYGYYLDRTISKTFEGRLWSVPAQVYAQPLELFAGLELSKGHLAIELIAWVIDNSATLPPAPILLPTIIYRFICAVYIEGFHQHNDCV